MKFKTLSTCLVFSLFFLAMTLGNIAESKPTRCPKGESLVNEQCEAIGALNGACRPNNVCDQGLKCVDGLCLTAVTEVPTGGLNEKCNNGGTCDTPDALKCEDDKCVDINKIIYAGTVKGVYRTVDGGDNWSVIGYKGVRSIITTADGAMYAGTFDDGVYMRKAGSKEWTNISADTIMGAAQTYTLASCSGNIYAGTSFGVTKYTGGAWVKIGGNFSIPTYSILCSGQDIYIGASDGFYKLTDSAVTSIGTLSNVFSLCITKQQIYMGAGNSIWKYDMSVTPPIWSTPIYFSRTVGVYDLICLPDGTVYGGTSGKGLVVKYGDVSDKEWKFLVPTPLKISSIAFIDGAVYIGSESTVSRYKDGGLETLNTNMGTVWDVVVLKKD